MDGLNGEDGFSHSDSLFSYFQLLYHHRRFFDVSLHSDGQFVAGAHRLVLAAYSTHFETALLGVEGSANITLDIDPKITGVSADDLAQVIEFMYTGRAANQGTLCDSGDALGCISLVSLLRSREASQPGTIVEDASHAQRLLDCCRGYYLDSRFCDLVVNCQGLPLVSCHRSVLCAYSDHFESALAATENCPQVTLDIDSSITGVTSVDLRTIIDFMYSGVLRIARKRMRGLSAAARALGVAKLVDLLTVNDWPVVSGGGRPPAPPLSMPPLAHHQPYLINDVAIGHDNLQQHHHHHINTYAGQTVATLTRENELIAESLQFDIGEVGATEDVGSSAIDDDNDDSGVGPLYGVSSAADPFMSVGGGSTRNSRLMQHHSTTTVAPSNMSLMSLSGAHNSGREVTASDDYVDIYEQFVSGPRRGRKGGTYGRKQERVRIKGPAPSLPIAPKSEELNQPSDDLSFLDQPPSTSGTSAIPTSGHADDRDDVSQSTATANALSIAAVTMSYTPSGKRRRATDSFGYGLPEIVGSNDVTVPLLVGDQQAMMEKPFKCPYCDHRTKEKSAVEKHIRCIHTLEAPYKCRFCNQAFKVQSNLVRHIRAHTGEKPYVCKKCGAAYADKKNMDAHVFREHLKMKPLECPAGGCSAKFWRHDRFNHHCRKLHGFEPSVEQESIGE